MCEKGTAVSGRPVSSATILIPIERPSSFTPPMPPTLSPHSCPAWECSRRLTSFLRVSMFVLVQVGIPSGHFGSVGPGAARRLQINQPPASLCSRQHRAALRDRVAELLGVRARRDPVHLRPDDRRQRAGGDVGVQLATCRQGGATPARSVPGNCAPLLIKITASLPLAPTHPLPPQNIEITGEIDCCTPRAAGGRREQPLPPPCPFCRLPVLPS